MRGLRQGRFRLVSIPSTSSLAEGSLGSSIAAVGAHPATANCQRILDRGEHVLIGVSPFNTRFTKPYLARLFSWAKVVFDDFNVLIPGERQAALMLEAGGTPAPKSVRKSRKELNRVVRLINTALDAARVSPATDAIIRISDFSDHPTYRQMAAAAEATYYDHPCFRAACQEMSGLAVHGRQRAVDSECAALTDQQIALASSYIFAEIPFFTNTPALLGKPGSLLAYHRPWPIGELLFSGELPIRVDPRQGYVVVRVDEERDSARVDAD
jgi:tRNA-dependent cyclodipeptide synthase